MIRVTLQPLHLRLHLLTSPLVANQTTLSSVPQRNRDRTITTRSDRRQPIPSLSPLPITDPTLGSPILALSYPKHAHFPPVSEAHTPHPSNLQRSSLTSLIHQFHPHSRHHEEHTSLPHLTHPLCLSNLTGPPFPFSLFNPRTPFSLCSLPRGAHRIQLPTRPSSNPFYSLPSFFLLLLLLLLLLLRHLPIPSNLFHPGSPDPRPASTSLASLRLSSSQHRLVPKSQNPTKRPMF